MYLEREGGREKVAKVRAQEVKVSDLWPGPAVSEYPDGEVEIRTPAVVERNHMVITGPDLWVETRGVSTFRICTVLLK